MLYLFGLNQSCQVATKEWGTSNIEVDVISAALNEALNHNPNVADPMYYERLIVEVAPGRSQCMQDQ